MVNHTSTLFGFILHTNILDVLYSDDIKILINIYKPIIDLYCMNNLIASPWQWHYRALMLQDIIENLGELIDNCQAKNWANGSLTLTSIVTGLSLAYNNLLEILKFCSICSNITPAIARNHETEKEQQSTDHKIIAQYMLKWKL